MDTGRTSPAAIAAAVGGAVIIVSLFLDWVGVSGLGNVSLPPGAANLPGASAAASAINSAASQSGWEVNHGFDVYLLIVGIFAIVPGILAITGSDAEIPYFSAGVGFLLTSIGIVCMLVATFVDFPDGADRKIGIWLCLIALIGTAVAQYFAMRDEVEAGY